VTRWCMKEVYLDCKCALKGMHEGRNLGVCRVWPSSRYRQKQSTIFTVRLGPDA
jgi:hypothetical protein